MTDINLSFDDEQIEGIPEGLDILTRFLEDAQHVLDYPDAYNKAEVLSKLEFFVEFLSESLKEAAPIMEGTYEIHQMTKDPNS